MKTFTRGIYKELVEMRFGFNTSLNVNSTVLSDVTSRLLEYKRQMPCLT
jgi:hypothetical protein